MSGGSQHNPNGRQSQLTSGWSPLQLQMANYLARAPQAHMASERGVTWHTPTPPHLYHVPSPPDPLQSMKAGAVGSNSVFRHTATPPDLYRHTPTPPDKHHMRHTPSPGDHKTGTPLPPSELYPHLGPARDKLVRPEDMLSYARGVDLSVTRVPPPLPPPALAAAPLPPPAQAANGAPIALSVRDAPTINSLIARAQRPAHSRVDSLLERLAPPSPHSVIVHPRGPTPSPPSSNEDSENSCGPPGSKRKRKPDKILRVAVLPPPGPRPDDAPEPPPTENGETHRNGASPEPPVRRKRRSGSAETIDDIAAMIASKEAEVEPEPAAAEAVVEESPVTIDKLKRVLASPEQSKSEEELKSTEVPQEAAAPKRRSARASNSSSTNVPVESPSEAKPAEPEAGGTSGHPEPVPASIVEVEDQLEKMFAGIEPERADRPSDAGPKGKKRRRSAPTKGGKKCTRRGGRASVDEGGRKSGAGGKKAAAKKPGAEVKDAYAYDSGSNASSGRSRGPYIQIRGPRDSPLSVSVMNAATGEDECEGTAVRRKTDPDFRNGLRTRGLHCSTLGLRYDAVTPDASWVCVFCEQGPHPRTGAPLGDLFGPYAVATDCEEFRALEAAARPHADPAEVWFHEDCAVWAPGLVAGGARLWGLPAAVWGARASRCARCGGRGAGVACGHRGCPERAHVPCARALAWTLDETEYRSTCPRHA